MTSKLKLLPELYHMSVEDTEIIKNAINNIESLKAELNQLRVTYVNSNNQYMILRGRIEEALDKG